MSINIIGAGLAGLSAALTLAEHGIKSNLISAQQSERAQSVMAEGGINACLNTMGESDKIKYHYEDTMRGGVFLSDPNSVKGLCEAAPSIVKKFERLGVPFEYNRNGIIQRNFGGQKKKRTAYVKSSTGKMLMTALIDEVRKYEAQGLVTRYANHRFLRLIINDNRCCGAVIQNIYTNEILTFGGSVILATGGLNGLFDGLTTGTTQNTSDAAAAVFAQGVELANLEMIQYHPTTIQIQGKRLLISEAARGEGGRLFIKRNGKPWYFMEEKYPELKNLMPRDVVSAEMVTVTALPECDKQVYLDMTGIEKTVWKTRLSDLREQCVHYLSLDPAKEPIPVSPGIHYFMGGIRVDAEHRTSMENLYASGECACQYHGANRLGGNSLLGAVYGGQVAAQTVMTEAKEYDKKAEKTEANTAEASPAFVREIREILYRALPIIRNESNMNNALSELNALRNTADNQTEINRANLALAVVQSAIGRRESRGAHKRADYPERDDNKFKKQTVARLKNGKVDISFKEIGEALS